MSDEAIGLLSEGMEEVALAKGDILLRAGDRVPFVWFVKEGLARAYIEPEAKDVTLWFASDGEMINFVYRDTAVYHVEMVDDSVLYRIPSKRLERLFAQSHDIALWGLKLLDHYLTEYENYFINDSWSDAREQYESLLRSRPDLFQKVPLKHIASYLQITPQSLSRIRSSPKK